MNSLKPGTHARSQEKQRSAAGDDVSTPCWSEAVLPLFSTWWLENCRWFLCDHFTQMPVFVEPDLVKHLVGRTRWRRLNTVALLPDLCELPTSQKVCFAGVV